MQFDIELQGFDEIINAIDKLIDNTDEVVENSLKKGGQILLNKMRDTVPVDTGRLKNSLEISNLKTDADGIRYISVGDVHSKSGYAWYVEAQNPFMARAKRSEMRDIKKLIIKDLQDTLGRLEAWT